jgi:hypothetical protein
MASSVSLPAGAGIRYLGLAESGSRSVILSRMVGAIRTGASHAPRLKADILCAPEAKAAAGLSSSSRPV